MDEIVSLMTQERFMNKLIIILAGYEHEINSLFSVNPGLSSRFAEEIMFQNMTFNHHRRAERYILSRICRNEKQQ